MTKKDSQSTTNGGQDVAELQEQFLRLGEALRQKTAQCDELRIDIIGLLAELTEERQQRIEANALLLATARALGLDDGEIDDLPQKAAVILAEGSAACQAWDEKCKQLQRDYDEAMRQYDEAQKRACEAEATLSVVQEVARWLHKISLWECDGWPDESRVGLEARYYKKQTLSCHIGSVRLGDLRKLKERMKDGEEDQ